MTEDTVRPEYVLESNEDLIYHDNREDTRPEFCAFMRKVMVFNKAMKWRQDRDHECIICYSEGGHLQLTGYNQASSWHSDPVNHIENFGDSTHFTKRSLGRHSDCNVLPAFQFHLNQHPKVELHVSVATSDWQLCIFIKGRSGPPLICSGWQSGEKSLSFDIAQELKNKGYHHQFAELHFVVGSWNPNPDAELSITYSLRLPGQPAMVSCLPVIRTRQNSEQIGVPVAAVVLNSQGETLSHDQVQVYARLGEKKVALEEQEGIWKAKLDGLTTGDHLIELSTEGAVQTNGFVNVRITDGHFFSFDEERKLLMKDNKVTGPLSGSYQGMAFFKNAGLADEKMINGQEDWDSWDRTISPGEHWHYWESMTEEELDKRFGYLEQCGWNLLHLCQHFGNWKRLDVGGKISPHGAEQVALYYRTAAKHNIAVLQALSHYAYGTVDDQLPVDPTLTYQSYLDNGFKSGDWLKTDNSFTGYFHEYLRHFICLFKDETALFAMTTSGEGDWLAGKDRVNDTCEYVHSLDPNHLFLSEPIHWMKMLPHNYYDGWRQVMFGSRVYFVGQEILPEYDLGVEFKFMQLGPLFMGEGSWPCFPKYADYNNKGESWCGTLRYRNRLRDSIYLALVHKNPVILTWDEQIAEDERIVFEEVRKLVDWEQNFIKPQIAIMVDETNVVDEGRKILAEYEMFFVSMPLNYRLVIKDQDEMDKADVVIDATRPFKRPDFQSNGGNLPDSLRNEIPLQVSEGYSTSYLWSENKQTLLAYLYNCTNHTEQPLELAGHFHRIPEPVNVKLTFKNQPNQNLRYKIYDLNEKRAVRQGELVEGLDIELGFTSNDFLIVILPN